MNDQPGLLKRRLIRIQRAFIVSIHGFVTAWRGETAFREEIAAACIFIPLSLLLPISLPLRLLLLSSVVLILIVELINSAIESTIDLITEDHHPLAKSAKDMASASVLAAIFLSVVLWLIVLGWLLIRLLSGAGIDS